jgi:hypothetical protein
VTAERLRLVLHAIGYPVAIVVIARLKAVFRERRTSWFYAEETGTAAIVAGWALVGRWPAVVVNAVWGVGLAFVWHLRRPQAPPRPDPATTTAT